jgi:hypothetical protein
MFCLSATNRIASMKKLAQQGDSGMIPSTADLRSQRLLGLARRQSRLRADKRDKGWGYPCRAPVAAILALALSGCATTRYSTAYCITPAQLTQLKAAKPAKIRSQLTGQADSDLKLVAGRLVRVEAYADGLIDILGGCVDPNK